MHQTYHLVGCHATGINSLLTSILSALRCAYSSFNTSSKNCCRQNLSPSLITQINNIAAFFNVISYGNLSLVSINSFKFFDVHSFNLIQNNFLHENTIFKETFKTGNNNETTMKQGYKRYASASSGSL